MKDVKLSDRDIAFICELIDMHVDNSRDLDTCEYNSMVKYVNKLCEKLTDQKDRFCEECL